MIMWFSESWKQHNLAQVNCLSQQTKQKLSQDNLFPSLLSLLDVKLRSSTLNWTCCTLVPM